MALVAYAGKEPVINRRKQLAYAHFSVGRDTAAIAYMLKISEATALRWITEERCLHRSLPNPYQSKR
jgi:hypothetical protein